MSADPGRVELCYWCPDPAHPSRIAHPDGEAKHRAPPPILGGSVAVTPAEALRFVCEAALYWQATPATIEAVRVLLPDQVDEILEGL